MKPLLKMQWLFKFKKLLTPRYNNNGHRKYHRPRLFITPDEFSTSRGGNKPADSVLTTIDMTEKFVQEIGQCRTYSPQDVRQSLREREQLMDLLPKTVEELPPRSMVDSFASVCIPLKDRTDIRERYVTSDGSVRLGRVLEDMDIFSVYCCLKHILNPRRSEGQRNPYSVVTALVDSIHVNENWKIRSNEDVRISGHVSFVGRSSMETSLVVDQKDESDQFQKILDAVFLMVARDPLNKGAALVNPLKPGKTEEERQYLLGGSARQAARKAQELDSLSRKPPNEEERNLVHNIFIQEELKSEDKSGVEIKIEDTSLRTVFICHPEYRNRYNKVFGGFIMRQASELAFTNAFLYAKRRPMLVHIDDIVFTRPVEIGSILRYSSHIGYVEGNYIQCPVKAEVISPTTGEGKVTNVFHFTFKVVGSQPVPELTFRTYREAMVYLESRRHFQKMMASH